MQPMSKAFISAMERFARDEAIPMIRFGKERKDDVVKKFRDRFPLSEGVPVIGKAQERAKVGRTEKRRDKNGRPYPWLVHATAMTYDLRRMRLHGLIRKIPKSNRDTPTDFGGRYALFVTRAYARLFLPGLAQALPNAHAPPSRLRDAVERVDRVIERAWYEGRIAT